MDMYLYTCMYICIYTIDKYIFSETFEVSHTHHIHHLYPKYFYSLPLINMSIS